MSERSDALLARVSALDSVPESRRREHLTERVIEAGHSLEYADLIYDVAAEEGLDPALAFELVLSGVGVRELAGAPDDAWAETQMEAPPPWVRDPALPEDEAARERRARVSFRRLRGLLDRSNSAEEALRAFVREVDVGDIDY